MEKLKKDTIKRNQGVTLIALVVTIVILIILAAVSVTMLIGDNGIILQAQKAVKETSHAYVKETVMFELAEYEMKGKNGNFLDYLKSEDGGKILTTNNVIKVSNFQGGEPNLGKGEGSDIYVLENMEDEYILKYYDKNQNEEIVDKFNVQMIGQEHSKYFTYVVDEQTKTAKITGIKGEYKKYGYYNNGSGLEFGYLIGIIDEDKTITDIIIPSKINKNGTEYTVTTIGKGAFLTGEKGWSFFESDFTSFYLPDTIINIEQEAFYGCEKLRVITIPKSVKNVGKEAFYDCWLKTINYKGTEEEWKNINIDANSELEAETINYNYE